MVRGGGRAWRRSLPHLIYHIQIYLGGHQKIGFECATNTRPLLIGNLFSNRQERDGLRPANV